MRTTSLNRWARRNGGRHESNRIYFGRIQPKAIDAKSTRTAHALRSSEPRRGGMVGRNKVMLILFDFGCPTRPSSTQGRATQ